MSLLESPMQSISHAVIYWLTENAITCIFGKLNNLPHRHVWYYTATVTVISK